MTTNTFFYDGMTTEAERKDAMTSPMWPIVVAAMNACDGGLRVGTVKKQYSDINQLSIELVNSCGFMVARAYTDRGVYYLNTYSDGTSVTNGYQRIKSKRPKYIAQQLKKPKDGDDGSELYSDLRESLRVADLTPNKIMYEFLNDTVRSMYDSYSAPTATVSDEMATILLRMYMKEMRPSEVDAVDQTKFDNAYKKYCEKRNRLHESFTVVRDLFSKDKWVLIYDYLNNSVIVGALGHHPAQAAVDLYIREGTFRSPNAFSYAQIVHPFQWYPKFDAIPDDIRKELEIQLMMYKVNTNSDQLLPRTSRGLTLWAEGGMAIHSDWGDAPVVIMDKQS